MVKISIPVIHRNVDSKCNNTITPYASKTGSDTNTRALSLICGESILIGRPRREAVTRVRLYPSSPVGSIDLYPYAATLSGAPKCRRYHGTRTVDPDLCASSTNSVAIILAAAFYLINL